MKTKLTPALIVLLLAASAVAAAPSSDADRVEAAKALFDRYVDLEHSFDPAMVDLYADDAVIRNTRRYPTGQVRKIELTGAEYKALIRQTLPLAKARSDRSTYSNVTYTANEDGTVTIEASRYSELKHYTSPIRITVARGEDGEWQIVEELSESQP